MFSLLEIVHGVGFHDVNFTMLLCGCKAWINVQRLRIMDVVVKVKFVSFRDNTQSHQV